MVDPPLSDETLHITVSIIDRAIQQRLITNPELSLLGITALLIATKFEDIVVPKSEMLCYLARPLNV